MKKLLGTLVIFLLTSVAFAHFAGKPRGVFTHRYDSFRSGVNSQETLLNHSLVQKNFGKLCDLPVDGLVFAQPLYIPERRMSDGASRNIVIVATMKNFLYAFDADCASGRYLWRTSLAQAKRSLIAHEDPRPIAAFRGILSTPYVDLERGVIFVSSLDVRRGHDPAYKFYKIDINTGKILKVIGVAGSLPGTGVDAQIIGGESRIVFDPNRHLQRPAVTLHKGFLHLAFGSLGDQEPFHGWIFSYNADDLSGGPSFITTPTGLGGGTGTGAGAGIWQSGQGLTADEQGFLYLATGNGGFSETDKNWGNSILKLDFSMSDQKFQVLDYFTPFNQRELADLDLDVGSAGILFIPPRYLVGAGKTGKFYILNRDSLGGHTPERNGDVGAIQVMQATEPSWKKIVNNTLMWNIHGSPVHWNNQLFVMGESDPVKAFRMDPQTGRVEENPVSRSKFSAPIGMPGGFLTLSVNEAMPETSAIVWVAHPISGDATFESRPGILHALDANNLGHELWNSKNDPADDYGLFAKFVPPVVANGKIFMATFSEKVVVYGKK